MAAITPRLTPISSETRIAAMASSKVAGTYSAKSSRTGFCVPCEIPRSPCRTPPRYVRYCTGNGSSNPLRSRNACTISGSAMAD